MADLPTMPQRASFRRLAGDMTWKLGYAARPEYAVITELRVWPPRHRLC